MFKSKSYESSNSTHNCLNTVIQIIVSVAFLRSLISLVSLGSKVSLGSSASLCHRITGVTSFNRFQSLHSRHRMSLLFVHLELLRWCETLLGHLGLLLLHLRGLKCSWQDSRLRWITTSSAKLETTAKTERRRKVRRFLQPAIAATLLHASPQCPDCSKGWQRNKIVIGPRFPAWPSADASCERDARTVADRQTGELSRYQQLTAHALFLLSAIY